MSYENGANYRYTIRFHRRLCDERLFSILKRSNARMYIDSIMYIINVIAQLRRISRLRQRNRLHERWSRQYWTTIQGSQGRRSPAFLPVDRHDATCPARHDFVIAGRTISQMSADPRATAPFLFLPSGMVSRAGSVSTES